MAEAPGYWKAEHALAMRQVASLEARVKGLEEALTEIAGSDDVENALDPARNKRIARAALKDIPDA